MAITAVSASALSTLVAEFGPQKAEVQINLQSKLLESKALRRIPGTGEYVAKLYESSTADVTWVADNARLPEGQGSLPLEAKALPKALIARISQGAIASGLQMSEDQVINSLDKELDQRMEDFGRGLGRGLFGGTIAPQAGTTWSSTAADATATVSFLDVSLFIPGSAVNFVDLTATKSYTVRVQSRAFSAVGANSANVAGTVTFINDVVDPATSAVIALTDTTIATGDTFAQRGTYPGFGGSATASGDPMANFDDICGTGAFMGVTPSSNPTYMWTGHTVALAAAYSQEAVIGFQMRLATASGTPSDVFACNPQILAAHASSGGQQSATFGHTAGINASNTRALDASVDKYGDVVKGSGYKVGGADIIGDQHCAVGKAICFPRSKVALVEWKKMSPREQSGEAILVSQTHYSNNILMDARINLVVDKRHACGSVTGITGT